MFRVNTKITFTQLTPFRDNDGSIEKRNGQIIFKFVHEFEVKSSWDTLTDDGTITLPKNVTVIDKTGRRFSLGGSNINIGGFSDTVPVFLRGDQVKIESGYIYYDQAGNEVAPLNTVFEGYISEVTSKKPFVLKVEDNMFLLKQYQAVGVGGRKFFHNYTVETIVRELFTSAGLPFTVNGLTKTTVGDVTIQNETIAEVLARFRKDFHFESYFRGSELRIGSWPYVESDAITDGVKKFVFQRNIISDRLEYRRKDDIVLSAVCSNTIEETTGQTTRDGQLKTKKVKLEVLITFKNGSATPEVIIGSKTNPIPPNTGGERHQFFFWGVTDINELISRGTDKLKRYYYTGFKGSFKTFGIPFTRIGDDVDILDKILPERNGRYKVKSVEYSGGVNGNRQNIELEYLIGRLDSTGKFIGL